MGSHRISFWREKHPGMLDYQLAEQLSAIEPREGAIIVRYKSGTGGVYDQFGSCADDEKLLSYFSSQYCHDTEILYVHPLVPLDKVPSGLKISDEAPTDSRVFKLKQSEEAKRKALEEVKEKKRKQWTIQEIILLGLPIGIILQLTAIIWSLFVDLRFSTLGLVLLSFLSIVPFINLVAAFIMFFSYANALNFDFSDPLNFHIYGCMIVSISFTLAIVLGMNDK
ncbi:MAG: hypothetical protein ABSE05_09100 [Syntrophales bacterium]|jgi:hypothetical protein